MADLKTKANEESPESFLNTISDPKKKADSLAVVELIKEVAGETPRMWGGSIIGFGQYHYKYESGREGDWFLTGFSPRKQNLTLYIMSGFEKHQDLLTQLGKHKTAKCCLYIKKLEDINLNILRKLIKASVAELS